VEWSDADPYTLSEQIGVAVKLYQLKPDLVHFINPSIPVAYFGKHVTTLHDFTLVDYKNIRGSKLVYELKYQIFRFVMWMAARFSTAVITDTKFVAKQVVERYRRSSSDVFPILLGVSSSLKQGTATRIAPKTKDRYLLYVGNFYPYKNIKRLIDSMVEIRRTQPDLKLVLVGKDDSFAKDLQIYAAHVGVSDTIEFTGFVTDSQLARYYQSATAYVFPSLSEGFGLPPLEAMSFGVPVIAADASCIPEVLGDAAVYFNPHSIENIGQVINETINDKKLMKELGAKGVQHFAKFSWANMASDTLSVYRVVLTQTKKSGETTKTTAKQK
jgi:glycosyltransferase involved in cell wall biosynthesis